MKSLLPLLFLAFVSACAVPGPYEDIVRPQRAPDGDVTVRAPNRHRDRDEWREASARCAQYGRVARNRNGRNYDCVSPSEASPSDAPR